MTDFFGAASVSVLDHGAVADGLTLCDAAFDAAVADLISRGGGTLWVPPGHYRRCQKTVIEVYGGEHIAIRGGGQHTTRLDFSAWAGQPPVDGGVGFVSHATTHKKPSFEVQGVGIYTSADNCGDAVSASWANDLNIDEAMNIRDVGARKNIDRISDTGTGFGFWSRGLVGMHARNSAISNFYFIGDMDKPTKSTAGISLHGQSTSVQISDVTVLAAITGALATDICEGVYFRNSDFVAVTYGIRHNIVAGAEPQLTVDHCHINASNVCVWLNNSQQSIISGSLLYAFSGYGVAPWWGIIVSGANAKTTRIIGNAFEKDGGHTGVNTHGVHLQTGRNHMLIGNQFTGRNADPITYGIITAPGVSNVVKVPNQSEYVTTPGF